MTLTFTNLKNTTIKQNYNLKILIFGHNPGNEKLLKYASKKLQNKKTNICSSPWIRITFKISLQTKYEKNIILCCDPDQDKLWKHTYKKKHYILLFGFNSDYEIFFNSNYPIIWNTDICL